ncbi:MAG: LapA family protein [Deltaproteobacteria bacterium]|nr:LapA family protein [Deltaproteobacteria bacterium]
MNKAQQATDNDARINFSRRISGWTYIRIVLAVLCVILTGVLVIQNAVPVRMYIFLWSLELSMAVVLFFSVAIGVAIGISICGWLLWKKQHGNAGGNR